MSNIYLKSYYWEKLTFSKLQFSKFKNLSPGQVLESSNSCRYHWILKCFAVSESNRIRTHNHLVHKQKLNHLDKLAKWLSCVVSTCLYLICMVQLIICYFFYQIFEMGQLDRISFFRGVLLGKRGWPFLHKRNTLKY